MNIKELNALSSREFISTLWGDDILAVIDATETTPMTCKDFLNHCIACGGNWTAMLLTGIKVLYPNVYDAIPEKMGKYAWNCLCEVLALLNISDEQE